MVADKSILTSRADWRGARMAENDQWIYRLSAGEIEELDAALAHAKAKGLSGDQISRDDFPLDSLSETLDALTDELVDGRGFVLIRGLPVDRYSKEDAGSIYWGMGTYIGRPWPQNARGDLLGDVLDTGKSITNPHVRGYETNVHLPFHTDGSDLVGLLCLRDAKSGGLSSLVSSVACHNEIARTRPDLLERLYQPFFYDWRGEHPKDGKPYYEMPVFTRHAGRLFNRYIRGYINSAQRFPELPRLTGLEIEALDTLDALTVNAEFRLDMVLEPGDMQFINNYVLFHSRTEFQDWDELDRRRHLKRLWLATDKFESRPPSFEDRGYDRAGWLKKAS